MNSVRLVIRLAGQKLTNGQRNTIFAVIGTCWVAMTVLSCATGDLVKIEVFRLSSLRVFVMNDFAVVEEQ